MTQTTRDVAIGVVLYAVLMGLMVLGLIALG